VIAHERELLLLRQKRARGGSGVSVRHIKKEVKKEGELGKNGTAEEWSLKGIYFVVEWWHKEGLISSSLFQRGTDLRGRV